MGTVLTCPLPAGARIVSARSYQGETWMTVQLQLPAEVLDRLSTALELASRLTGSDRLPVLVGAVADECCGEWWRQAEEQARQMGAGEGWHGS